MQNSSLISVTPHGCHSSTLPRCRATARIPPTDRGIRKRGVLSCLSRGTKLVENDAGDNRLYLGLPAVRSIRVADTQTGRTLDVKLYMAGGTVRIGRPPGQGSPGEPVGSGAPAACRMITVGADGGGSRYRTQMMGVRNGQASAGAFYNAKMRLQQLYELRDFEFIFRIEADSPLLLPSGAYTGSTKYIVGQDFRFGANANVTSDPVIDVHFTLTVEHQYAVFFLPRRPKSAWLDWRLAAMD